VRRSFALPAQLVEQVSEAVPPEYGSNANAAVRHALEDYVKRKREADFERRMDEMAADPWIRAVNAEIFRDFERLDGEGLPPP
jgi:Arc/MetJ-type ribon-helix-helix transcriptional regulator